MLESTLTSKGQTTIPAKIREALNVQAGDRLIYSVQNDGVLIKRKQNIADLAGCLRPFVKRWPDPKDRDRLEAEAIAKGFLRRYRRSLP